jgi:hypothetical protein
MHPVNADCQWHWDVAQITNDQVGFDALEEPAEPF